MSGYRDETLEAYAIGKKKLHPDGAGPICEELLMYRRLFRARRELMLLNERLEKEANADVSARANWDPKPDGK